MGMTIERTIEIYNDHDRISGILLRGNSEEETKYNCETIEAMNNINVILHKYQKIEEIVKQYKKFGNIDFSMQIISGVVEDGNDNN